MLCFVLVNLNIAQELTSEGNMPVHYKQLKDNFKYLTTFDEKNIGHFKVFVNKN